jgi:hypothetical protein
MLILDPGRNDCTIWSPFERKIQRIIDNPDVICRKIMDIIIFKGTSSQRYRISVDCCGTGEAYRYIFEKNKIDFFKMKAILPIKR